MDTSFWDDDEDRVQIVYQDDQLPPLQAPQEHTAGAGRKFDLRERFAEAQLKGAEGPSFSEIQPEIDTTTAENSKLHQCATQALAAAAAYAEGPCSPPTYNAAAITPQPARTGIADASSSHQPGRHYSHAEQRDTGGLNPSALSQAKSALPTSSGAANLLFSPRAPPQQAGQPAHKKAQNVQTPGFHIKTKKPHPLYKPVSVPGKSIQQKKGKPKAGGGFAIRQPAAAATAGPAATKPISTKDALSLLVGAPTQRKSALNAERHSVQQDRPGSIAELLGITEPINPDEGVEDVDVDVLELQQQQSPDHPDSARQLLDTMLEGRLSPAQERPVSQAPLRPAPSPWTPAARASDTADRGHDAALTPAVTLQRQFIASLQDTPAVSTSRYTSGRSQAMPGTLSGRLNRIVQLEKAQQIQFQATGSLGRQTMDVTVAEHRLEGHIVKCRCHKSNDAVSEDCLVHGNAASPQDG
ncbi:hypothetical protein ABBQ38_009273 [Trebouxia sp. C0009 RCD-2024]